MVYINFKGNQAFSEASKIWTHLSGPAMFPMIEQFLWNLSAPHRWHTYSKYTTLINGNSFQYVRDLQEVSSNLKKKRFM